MCFWDQPSPSLFLWFKFYAHTAMPSHSLVCSWFSHVFRLRGQSVVGTTKIARPTKLNQFSPVQSTYWPALIHACRVSKHPSNTVSLHPGEQPCTAKQCPVCCRWVLTAPTGFQEEQLREAQTACACLRAGAHPPPPGRKLAPGSFHLQPIARWDREHSPPRGIHSFSTPFGKQSPLNPELSLS